MAALVQLLTLAFLLLLSATASSSHQLDRIAAAASSLSNSTGLPLTVFAPSDSSILTACPSGSLPSLLHNHTVPGLFSLHYLRSLPSSTKIQTLTPSLCLTITSNASNVFVSGAEISEAELYNDGTIVVHGLNSGLSTLSCNVARAATSLSCLPHPFPQDDSTFVMSRMLKDAMVRLRLSGYKIAAVSLRGCYPDLVDLKAVTVFAVSDASILSDVGGHEYVTSFRFHVVPNRLLMASDLERLPAGTVLPTLTGRDLVVTTVSNIERPDLIYNQKMAVHGLSVPFRHAAVTAVIRSGQGGRCRGPSMTDEI